VSPPTAAARDWLASADPTPDHAFRWWTATEIALLPVGTEWDAVQVDVGRAQRAVEAAGLDGPVIHDPAGAVYYFLVPKGTSSNWQLDGSDCLGDACWLAIPAPARVAPPGLHWLNPPDGSGVLTDPEILRAALKQAA
jgi:hypothetical protein